METDGAEEASQFEEEAIDIPGFAVPSWQPAFPSLPKAWRSRYEVVPEHPFLGGGSFARVFQLRDKETQQFYACKVMERQFLEVHGMGTQVHTEIKAMQLLTGSSHVAQLHDVAEENGEIFILLELCHMGNLHDELCASGAAQLQLGRAKDCARHLLEGLAEIHDKGIMHRDIKPDNMLITLDGSLKICDFGWAAFAREQRRDLAGSFRTMAPEVLLGDVQTTAIDIWSAGVALFYLVTGSPLLDVETTDDPSCRSRLLADIQRLCPLSRAARPAGVSESCWDFLRSLLHPCALLRPSAREALQHSWLVADHSELESDSNHKMLPSTPQTASPDSTYRSMSSSSTESKESLLSI